MTSTCTPIINLKYPDGSLGSASNPEKFQDDQDFDFLKSHYVSRRKMFVDKSFAPNRYSLGEARDVQWCRPKEILEMLKIPEEPVFSSDGESRFDFAQGFIGNCWFLAAISSLTLSKKLKVQVVPKQSFDDYAGIFHFRFWRFGKWVDVVIDDLLPVFNDAFYSVHAKPANMFWVPLLEKAYAKVCGSYQDMDTGMTTEACKDLSGALSLAFHLQQAHEGKHDDELWLSLSLGTGCKSLICCGTASVNQVLDDQLTCNGPALSPCSTGLTRKQGKVVNSVNDNGLVNAHAYSVTGVAQVYHRGYKVKLVRLLNPWGSQEWNGKWSDNSPLWNQVSREDRAKCEKDDNGEFWMEWEDFCHNFIMLSICCENPNFMDGDLGCQWQLMTHEGKWDSAGGSLIYSTYHTNPQFRIQVDIRNDDEEFDMNCFVSLMQKPRQKNRKHARYYSISATVYSIPSGTRPGRLDRNFFRQNRPIEDIQHAEMRETVTWYSLSPGEYLIVPSTMLQHTRADFVLSIYTKTQMKIDSFEGEDEDDDHDHDHDHEENGTDEDLILPKIPTDHGPGDVDENADPKHIFEQYADWRGELNERNLQKLLNHQFSRGMTDSFSRTTCMDFIASMITDFNRMMNFEEFSALWEKLKKYQKVFLDADFNHNGVLDQTEMEQAIKAAGLRYNDMFVRRAMFRLTYGRSAMDLQSFLVLMFEMDHMTSFMESHMSEPEGAIILSIDDFWNF